MHFAIYILKNFLQERDMSPLRIGIRKASRGNAFLLFEQALLAGNVFAASRG